MEEHFLFEKQDGTTVKMPIVKVPVSLDGLSTDEKRMIELLSEATQTFIPICARQRHPESLTKYTEALELEKKHPELKHVVDLLSTALTIEDHYTERPKHAELLNMQETGKSQGLYPADISKEEADALEHTKHSVVVKENDENKVVANSKYFAQELTITDKKLEEAEALAQGTLKEHIRATRKLLLDESEENQDEQLQTWLANDNEIDIIFDTSREEGSDDILGVRGLAGAGVFRINKKYAKLTETLKAMMAELDEQAPWKYKAKNMETPIVRFVDVLTWAGDFTHPPICVLAQNLPNEQERKDKYGCISIMYANVTELVKEQSFPLFVKEFFAEDDFEEGSYVENLMTAVHELGHATSRVNFSENPAKVFGSEDYTVLEEARAETFALWALNYLREKDLVSDEQEKTGYYNMLQSMIASLPYPPKEHAGSRNLMLHYFLEAGAIEEKEGKFLVHVKKIRESATELLGQLGDIRSEGRVEDFKELKRYIKTDRKEEFEERFAKIPRGRIIIFPKIVGKDDDFVLEYPEHFREQQNSLQGWMNTQ